MYGKKVTKKKELAKKGKEKWKPNIIKIRKIMKQNHFSLLSFYCLFYCVELHALWFQVIRGLLTELINIRNLWKHECNMQLISTN